MVHYRIGVFKFINLQTKNKHGINISHPVMRRKRNSRVGNAFLPPEQQKLTGYGRKGNHRKVYPIWESRRTVHLIESGTYLKALNTVLWFQISDLHFIHDHTLLSAVFLIQIFYLEIPLCLSALIFFGNILTFVVKLFTSCQADLHLDQAVLEINLQRNQRVTFFLDLILQLADLIIMKQQLPDSQRILIKIFPFS